MCPLLDKGAVKVAPRAGAWIEISQPSTNRIRVLVAPRAGAWIEIVKGIASYISCSTSHPVRVRGLKCEQLAQFVIDKRRTPCGCVD